MLIQARCINVVRLNDTKETILKYLIDIGVVNQSSENIERFLENIPPGTIIAKKVIFNSNENTENFVCLPFFSSHFKVPVKPGEYIWVYPYVNFNQQDVIINGYWLSRVHASKFSEDVNYTFNDRDISTPNSVNNLFKAHSQSISSTGKSKNRQEVKKHLKNVSQYVIAPNTFFDGTFEIAQNEKNIISQGLSDANLRCVTPVMCHEDDFLLQGSNSTYLKLTTEGASSGTYKKQNQNKGEVIIAAGCGEYANTKYTLVKGKMTSPNGIVYNGSSFSALVPDAENVAINFKSTNTSENLKNPEAYFHNNLVTKRSHLGATKIKEDASRITISESSNYLNEIYSNFNSALNINNFSKNKRKKTIEDKLGSEFNTSNFKLENKNLSSNNKKRPSVNIVSNDINILSREGKGSIGLLKEYRLSDNTHLHSHLSLNESGDIFIDASRIFIGSSNLQKKKGSFANGKGDLVILGSSSESQPLVLGQELKQMIVEMNNTNIEAMDTTKNLFIEAADTLSQSQTTASQSIITALTSSLSSSLTNLTSPLINLASNPSPTGAEVSATILLLLTELINLQIGLMNSVTVGESQNQTAIAKFQNTVVQAPLFKMPLETIPERLDIVNKNIDLILSKTCKTS